MSSMRYGFLKVDSSYCLNQAIIFDRSIRCRYKVNLVTVLHFFVTHLSWVSRNSIKNIALFLRKKNCLQILLSITNRKVLFRKLSEGTLNKVIRQIILRTKV